MFVELNESVLEGTDEGRSWSRRHGVSAAIPGAPRLAASCIYPASPVLWNKFMLFLKVSLRDI